MNKSVQSTIRALRRKAPLGRYLWLLLVAVVTAIGLPLVLAQWAAYQHFEALDRQGRERLELYASTVESAKLRFDYLPFIVSRDQRVQSLLSNGNGAEQVSRRLRAWQVESTAATLYLMNRDGLVLASSNWQEAESFVGNNYHFRPYFQDALAGGKGQFFAVGASTGKPGLFLSRPVRVADEVIGVAVVKIDMTQLETDWKRGGETVLVADNDGVIFLSSNPRWKYRSLEPIDSATLARLNQARKYSNREITPLPIRRQAQSPQGLRIIHLAEQPESTGDQGYLMHQRPLSELGWTLYYLSDLRELIYKKRSAHLIGLLITLLLVLSGFIFINRIQSRRLLELRVEKRTRALNQTNRRLQQEIDSRIETEQRLHQTHEELVQAEKLAALGQMSAGIVHEISQPLSAMQTFVASTRLLLQRDDRRGAEDNLDDIGSMIRRVNSIIGHLKSFASKSRGQTTPLEIGKVIDNALLILQPRLNGSDVLLNLEQVERPLWVIADEIKLEQILINLIRNALDAMQQPPEQDRHRLTIRTQQEQGRTHIFISDTGTGINPDDLPRVFDPFFTTKPTGEGLGLGLSVSSGIAREFGGDLTVVEHQSGGTLFKLSLDSAKAGTTHEKTRHA